MSESEKTSESWLLKKTPWHCLVKDNAKLTINVPARKYLSIERGANFIKSIEVEGHVLTCDFPAPTSQSEPIQVFQHAPLLVPPSSKIQCHQLHISLGKPHPVFLSGYWVPSVPVVEVAEVQKMFAQAGLTALREASFELFMATAIDRIKLELPDAIDEPLSKKLTEEVANQVAKIKEAFKREFESFFEAEFQKKLLQPSEGQKDA